MGIFAAVLLVFTILVRPQEFVPGLAALSILNVLTALAVLGIALEFGMGKIKSTWSPQLPYLGAFVVWCYVCTLIKAGRDLTHTNSTVFFSSVFMIVVMYAARSFERFVVMATLMVAVAMGLAVVGAAQASAGFECIVLEQDSLGETDTAAGQPTGRTCVLGPRECEASGDEAGEVVGTGVEYACEKPGPFDTFSIAHGRVRWRGILADPNELSLFIGAALAFAFALHGYSKNKMRHLVLVGCMALATYCVVNAQSRSGVLVLLGVIGIYFVRQNGWAGVVIGGILGAPLLLLGGREGEEADASTLERLGALYEGIGFVRENPVFGLGQGQFGEHYFITAHNSYLLAAAELGIPGMILWSLLVYVSMKIPYVVAFRGPPELDPRLRPFGYALFVAFCGFLTGIAFLSFCYHAVLFIYFGLAGALYGAAKQSTRRFEVTMGKKDYAAVVGIDAFLLIFLFVYTRIKGSP